MKLSKQKGSLTLEVVIAAFIFLAVTLGITNAFNTYLKGSNLSRPLTKAAFLLDEGAEAIRALRDQSWTSKIAALSNGTTYYLSWNSGTSLWESATKPAMIDGLFARTFTMSAVNRDATTKDIVSSGGSVDANIRLFTETVAWQSAGATTTRQTSFYLSNLLAN